MSTLAAGNSASGLDGLQVLGLGDRKSTSLVLPAPAPCCRRCWPGVRREHEEQQGLSPVLSSDTQSRVSEGISQISRRLVFTLILFIFMVSVAKHFHRNSSRGTDLFGLLVSEVSVRCGTRV